jgi:DNA-binding GntR family transcriptional regulator
MPPALDDHRVRKSGKAQLSSSEIYERVRRMAETFAFRPGERVNEIELARELDVSRTPLREVLNQLLVEGFLRREANKGFVCRALDPKQIYALYEFRRELEKSIARIASQRAGDDEIAELEAYTLDSKDVPEDEDSSRLLRLDEAFHMRLAHMTKNAEFERALDNVNARIHYVRWIDMQSGRRKYTQGEHLKIVDALKQRDTDVLVAMIDAHISRRMDQIVETVKRSYAEIYTRSSIPITAGAL